MKNETENLDNVVVSSDINTSEIIDAKLVSPSKQRVWEIDAFRGLMIFFVLWDHFMWDVRFFGPKNGEYQTALFQWLYEVSKSYYSGVLRELTQPVFVTLFVVTSGISCSFSRNNFFRGLKMALFSVAFTLICKWVAGEDFNCNVIHVIALSVLVWSLIERLQSLCKKDWQKNVFGVVMFVVTLTLIILGECINASVKGGYGDAGKLADWITNDNKWLFFLYQHKSSVTGYMDFVGSDYLPFLPSFGWFLLGAFLGKLLYPTKQTKFPSVNEKWVCPFTFVGRHSLWFYCGEQLILSGIFMLLFHS